MLHVICGSPCSGKSTYISQNAKQGDLIIDADKIANAFGGSEHRATGTPLKVALDARAMAIEHALKNDAETWLIDTMPSDENMSRYMSAKAEITLLDTPEDECLKRAEKRPEGTKEAVENWHKNAGHLFNNSNIRRKSMSETTATVTTPEENTTAAQEKTFTQSEVNDIVQKRLAKEKDSFNKQLSDWQAEKEGYLAQIAEHQNTIKGMQTTALKERIARESGIPFELAGRLAGETEDEIRRDAETMGAFLKPKAFQAPGKAVEPAGDNKQAAKKAALSNTLRNLRGED